MRLTKKIDNCYHILHNWSEKNTFEERNKEELGIQKLGQLEDILEGHKIETLEELDGLLWYVKQIKQIEQELGIDLITFFKIYNSDHFYIKNKYYPYKIKHYQRHGIMVGTNKTIYLSFKSYGKTWALTKEELENEKRN